MILPDKFTTVDYSLLAHAPKVMAAIGERIKIHDLLEILTNEFEDPDELILTLDLLFILNKVVFNEKTEEVESC